TLYVLQSVAVSVFGQENAMVWYFGDRVGLDFNEGSPVVLTDGEMKAEAGCATMCDNMGNLLFYTNGNKVWNRNHVVMANGDSLLGGQTINPNCVVVPLPFSNSIFYLFTVVYSDSISRLSYSIIYMDLESGLGKVTQKNIFISTNVLEKLAAVPHCNGYDFWIITHGMSNVFYSYLLTSSGINIIPVTSKTGAKPRIDFGSLKVSPASNKIVVPVNNDTLLAEIFNLDNSTGIISQPIQIGIIEENTYCYGVEFSPDGSLLYLSIRGVNYGLWQYDLESVDMEVLNSSKVNIATGNNFALQLAPDGKIYIACNNRSYLNSIDKPNEKGTGCGFQSQSVNFSQGTVLMTLPGFIQSNFYQPAFKVSHTCLSDTTHFVVNQADNLDSIHWNFGDTLENPYVTGSHFSVYHQFPKVGFYDVEARLYHCGNEDVIHQRMEISSNPVSSLPHDTILCSNCSLVLDAGDGFDYYKWSNDSEYRYLSVYQAGDYWVEVGKNGCFITDTVFIRELNPLLQFPNAFTPNADQVNDVFKAIGNINTVEFSISIVNRQGEIVYQSKDILKGWDGRVRGQSPMGETYVWYATYSFYNETGFLTKERQRGFVTLIR
ncbi:MAG: T9SS type B sorting domain-containing protein, partial [Bacteroidales bacterium]